EWTDHVTGLLDSDELTDGEAATVRASRALNRGFLSMLDALGSSLRAVHQDRRMQVELVEAQRMVLPASDVWLGPDLTVAGSTRAAGSCGGDFWVALPIGSSPRVAVLVGDVTGHGVPSTVIAAAVRGALELGRNLPDCTLGTLFDHAARVVHAMGRGQLMLTLAGGLFDPDRGEMVLANAGHRLPLLIRGPDSSVPGREIHPIVARGSPLGATEGSDCEYVTWPTRPDDVLCLYSDGMVEFDDPSGARFSERRLRAVLAAQNHADPRQMRDGILAELDALRAGRPRTDDITLVLARVTGGGRPE
ncbi:MAG: PP2C family protein-serine/threonine phosphatase, partial [Myxococcota bacterium]